MSKSNTDKYTYSPQNVLRTAGEAAKLTLQYGGGAHRAEDVYCRICRACGFPDAQVSAQITSLTVSLSTDDGDRTTIFRVARRGVNLSKLDMINDVSRGISDGSVDLENAERRLAEIADAPGNREIVTVLAAGFSSAFFALLLGGKVWDFVLTFAIGAFISYVLSFFERAGAYGFMNNLFGGILDAGLATLAFVAAARIGVTIHLEAVIVGAMMPLLPGLAMTNAIRDTISGDYVSGTAGVMEALSMAISLAAGVAVSFGIFVSLGVTV